MHYYYYWSCFDQLGPKTNNLKILVKHKEIFYNGKLSFKDNMSCVTYSDLILLELVLCYLPEEVHTKKHVVSRKKIAHAKNASCDHIV